MNFLKFCPEEKILKFGTKNALFGCFAQQVLKTVFTFEIRRLEFVLLQNLVQKQKFLNVGQKMPDLGIFGLECETNNVIFEITALEFVKLQYFVQE